MKSKVFKKVAAVITAMTMALGVFTVMPEDYLPQFVITASAETGDYLNIESSTDNSPINIGDEFSIRVTLCDASGSMKYTSYRSFDWSFSHEDGSEIGAGEIYCSSDYSYDILSFDIIPLKAEQYTLTVSYNDEIFNSISFSAIDEKDVLASGYCYPPAYYMQDVRYVVDNKNTLTISGNGYMSSFGFSGPSGTNHSDSRAPWFPFWTYIHNLVIEDNVQTIGSYAFYNCSALVSTNISDSVTKIGSAAFYKCTSLTSISLPSNLKTIGNNAFGETSLSEVIIPEGVSSIDNYAFLGCKELEKVIIPKDTYIGKGAFDGCNKLTIYGYANSTAETYANENNIPFMALDSSANDADEATLLERIKQLSGHEPSSYIYIDMNHDGKKELLALIPLDSSYRELWFCSSDATKCYFVEKVSYGIDYSDFKEIIYSNYSHVLYNSGNNFGNGQYFAVYSYNGNEIDNELASMGVATVNDNNIIQVTTRGYNENGVAYVYEKSYRYDTYEQKYIEVTGISDTVNVSWYNGTALILEEECKVNTKPEFKGDAPTCYYNEYGLKREFLGWTTSDNSDYSITIPTAIQPVTQDTKYYAVFSNKEPTPIISDDEVYDIDYINQHMESATKRDWDKMKAAMYLQDTFECPSLEASHAIWKTITIVDETVNLDYMGIYGEISANDYNLIMIDMFNSAEGYEKATSIIKESSYSGLVDWANLVKGCLTTALGDKIKPDENYNNAYNAFLKNPTYENMTTYIDASNALCKKNKMSPADVAVSQSLLESYKITDDVLSGLNTGISTFQDVVKNAETISAYCMYQHMSQEYLAILNDMYKEAEKLDSNSWEVADLKNAINFAKYYYSNPTDAAMMGIITNWAKNITQLFAGNLINDVIEDQTVHFIQFTGKYVSGSDKLPSGETVSSYLAAVQTGFKYGVKISDKLFDMNNRDNLYVKIKEYGVLSKVLSPVLNNRANALLSAKSIKEQYAAAKAYDKAYKMYMYIEGAAASNAAKYERTFESTIAIKTVLAIINPANIIYYNELDKNAAKHVENATILESYARTADSMFCHLSWADREDFVSILIDYSNKIKDHKAVIVSCPVEMRVYDSNHMLVGTLSASKTEIKAGYEPYLFRINETDSSVAVVPSDYTIEIVGLDSGSMRVIGSYFNGDTMINTVSYNNIPVDDNYIAVFEINEDTSTLSEENHTHSYSGSWKCDSTYHWHECSCGEKTDIAQHIANGGIVTVQPTSTTGVKTYSCSVCEYVMRTETIPATGVNGYPSYPTYPTYPTYTVTPSVFSEKLIGKSEIKGNTVTLKWDEVKNADKYIVYQYKNGKYVKVKTTADTSVKFKKLKNGETYKFLVRYTINGKLSPTTYSCKYTIKVYYKPIANATVAQNSVKLTWKTVPRAKKYAIYKYVDGKAVKLAVVKGTSVKINKLSSNTEYKYIVRAYVDGKWTTMTKSDIVTIKTKAE